MITKEEFLDKKNSELLKEVSTAMALNSEMNALRVWMKSKEKQGLKMCRITNNRHKDIKTNYHVHSVLINLIEMLSNGDLVFKDK